ncbi:MAG: HAMP domain-containing protein [Actinobacteria bacterium]|nr:HAMP domain-containing protein [Actinomycetota bacterium]
MKSDKQRTTHAKARSLILAQITVLLLIIFVTAGLLNLMLYRRSLHNLIDESKDKFIDSIAGVVSSTHEFISELLVQFMGLRGFSVDDPEIAREFANALLDRQLSSLQKAANDILAEMVESGLAGLDAVVVALPPTAPYTSKPLIIMSSNEKYIYSELPEEIAEIGETEKRAYRVFEKGVPAMGLEGAHVVTAYRFKIASNAATLLYYDFKPIQDDVDAIDSFYKTEMRQINTTLSIVIGCTVLVLILAVFLFLSHLIRTRISRPIDELSAAAEQVMEGNLDVEVEVRDGEEFEGLKRAFNEMLKSISKIIDGLFFK